MKKAVFSSLCCLVFLACLGQEVEAQNKVGQLLKNTAKDVVLDPTTYAPTALSLFGKKLDWDSSQIFFKNGYVESHPAFTISRLPFDTAISHAAGNKKIIEISLPVLRLSVLNNVTVSMSERLLVDRHPNHKKLIKSIGWIEKIAMASYFSYQYSNKNFSQWQLNKRMARELGLK